MRGAALYAPETLCKNVQAAGERQLRMGPVRRGTAVNPILVAIGECQTLGLRVTRIHPESECDPKAVILELDGEDEMRVPIESLDRETFMLLWLEAKAIKDIQWSATA